MRSAGAHKGRRRVRAPGAASLEAAPSVWRDHARALAAAVAAEPRPSVRSALARALQALGAGDWASAETLAKGAAAAAGDTPTPFRIMALAREGAEDQAGAIQAYQNALSLDPASVDLLSDVARLAQSMGLSDVAAAFLTKAWNFAPQSASIAGALASALLDLRKIDEAVEVLRSALTTNPDDAALWNTLGSALVKYGDTERGLVFLEQALSLAPNWREAVYNRAIAKLDLGDLKGCVEDCNAVIEAHAPEGQAAALLVRAHARLAAGELLDGWRDYEARLSPALGAAPRFDLPGERWTPGADLLGRTVLALGEQGLGDEIMFSSLMPDLLEAVGPQGRVVLAASPRLLSIFQRSFPAATAAPLRATTQNGRLTIACPPEAEDCDLWAPIGSFAGQFRPSVAHFTPCRSVLRPLPEELARWKRKLASLGPGMKVGICWKSLRTGGHRGKHYPPLDLWAELLDVPNVHFVNLQYGDCSAELAGFEARGASIFEPADLDRTNDLEGSLALSAALDLVIGVANASTAMAAAAGTPSWFILPPAPWPSLGTGRHPWYGKTRGFYAARFGEWRPVFEMLAASLRNAAAAEKTRGAPRP